MPSSHARVSTDRPARYGKQLASHLGRRIRTEWSEEDGAGRLWFDGGHGTMTAADGALLLDVEGEPDQLERLEDVVGRHLVRFGSKDELVAEWTRGDGTPGSVQRKSEE